MKGSAVAGAVVVVVVASVLAYASRTDAAPPSSAVAPAVAAETGTLLSGATLVPEEAVVVDLTTAGYSRLTVITRGTGQTEPSLSVLPYDIDGTSPTSLGLVGGGSMRSGAAIGYYELNGVQKVQVRLRNPAGGTNYSGASITYILSRGN